MSIGLSGGLSGGSTVDAISGLHVVSEHQQVVNIGSGTPVNTGHNLTAAAGMTLKVFARDQASDRGWQVAEIDVDNMLEIQTSSTTDALLHYFDNDYLIVNVLNATTGELAITQSGRDFEYVKSQLIAKLPQAKVEAGVTDYEGYLDIGPVRKQWGRVDAAGSSTLTITLPKAFADDKYTVAANGEFSGRVASISGHTPSSFVMDRRVASDGNPSTTAFRWFAVGAKPTT